MGFLKRALSNSFSWSPVLVAAHVTFTDLAEDAVLLELSQEFGAPKDSIEELEVSRFETVFALWVMPDEQKDGQRQVRLKDLIQRVESIDGVRTCILQHESIYFVNSAGIPEFALFASKSPIKAYADHGSCQEQCTGHLNLSFASNKK